MPVDKKVRIITTANDVIHAWMVPAFGVKQDAIPGFVRDTWFRAEKTGDFYGQCAELCGKEHAYMPIHVKVVSQEDYTKWVDEQEEGDGRRGRRPEQGLDAAPTWSRAARRSTPPTAPPATRPDGKGAGPIKPLDGSPIVLDADKAKQIDIVLNGQANGAMPPWKQLSDTEHRRRRSPTRRTTGRNKTGQIVQPAEVVAARK